MTLLGNYYGTPARPVTLLAGMRNAAAAGHEVLYARGADLVEGRQDPAGRATDRAGAPAPGRGRHGAGPARRILRGPRPPGRAAADARRPARWTSAGTAARRPTTLVARGELPADEALPNDDFSVRWTRPAAARRCRAATRSRSPATTASGCSWTAGRSSTSGRPRRARGRRAHRVDLSAGQPADVRLEYFEAIRDAEIRLGWRLPGRRRSVRGGARGGARARTSWCSSAGSTATSRARR